MSFLVNNGGLSKEDGSTAKYLAGVLSALVQAVGLERAAGMWKASRMNIEDFVPKDGVHAFASSHVSKETFERNIRLNFFCYTWMVVVLLFCKASIPYYVLRGH